MVGKVFTMFLTVLILSLTDGMVPALRRSTMVRAVITVFVVLAFFVIAGQTILAFLGIKPGSF